MFDLHKYSEEKRRKINLILANCIDTASSSNRIVQAMKYSLMAQGKRLRPILCIASAEAIGPVCADVFNAACAIEMIHTYSLIHDDLPAMDNDDLRRGKPTCHIEFDEATAILAGDALLTMAFQCLSSIGLKHQENALKWLKVIHCVSSAAGYQGMIEGQMRDMASEGTKLNLGKLEEMHRLKTGCLIRASVITGALLNGGDDDQMDRLAEYADHIGLAFQISDDILDIDGNSQTMGKRTGSDQQKNKNTYPSLLGLDESKHMAEQLVKKAIHALDNFDKMSDPLRKIAEYIIHRDK